MATQPITYPTTPTLVISANRSFSWSGIFAGTFLFLAIEATFSILGVAIFATATNPNAATPVGPGISIGAGIWMVVLSIIALYFAGKLASKLSGAVTRNIGMYAGLVTFGMCIFASILIAPLAMGNTVGGATAIAAYTSPSGLADMLMKGGYWLFAALVLGMISAASGGIHGAWMSDRTPSDRINETETKRAA
ncbi:MAG TPA: hypothetical protein VFE38_02740 [Edaphobacter sp.]|nr:hypothetical protein [Edaphobacter sp.]